MERDHQQPSVGPSAPASRNGTSLWLIPSIVMLGLGLRVYHYLLNPGVWKDELFLLRNIVGKSYVELLGPLVCDQAAPPLFLWMEHSVWLALGDSTLVLRLIPLLASCGALLLLAPVARACLRAEAVPWALLLFACSDKIVDHTIEAKQYMVDAFVMVLVPALCCGTKAWPIGRRLLMFAALAPVVIFSAFPGCFVMGGLLVAMLPEVWNHRRQPAAWLGYALVALTTLAAFGLLLIGPIHAQHTSPLAEMWTDTFPNWNQPWTVSWWCLRTNIGLLDHSFRPVGGALLPLAIIGGVSLWRRGRRAELLLLVTPVLLAMLAALMRAYPYGSRVMLYAVAPLALLIGEGAVQLVGWARQSLENHASWTRRAAGRSLIVVSVLLLLLPAGLSAYRAVRPWPREVLPWPEPPAAPSASD
jgi:hypothetical protein